MFKVFFNRRKQFFTVHLDDVSPATFHRQGGGRWGWFQETWSSPYHGEFGTIHIVKSRVRQDVVAHELLHLWLAWLKSRDIAVTRRNEEKLVLLYDELTRHFWNEYRKVVQDDS